MLRLAPDTIDVLPPGVRRPAYDRGRLAIGHAHIGVGAFHRCHQADFVDDMLEAAFGPWGIVGINLHPPQLAPTLGLQGGLFSRTLRQGTTSDTRVIGAIRQVIDVADPAALEQALAALAAPSVQVVTMTVTEKGYAIAPSSGELDSDHPGLRADLAGACVPRTLLGLLARALARRRDAAGGPVTLLSCDNIPANGRRLRHALVAFAGHRDAGLAGWMENNVAFPCTMVDRIVPAATPSDIDEVAAVLRQRDEAAVFGEAFRQWVIEDAFAGTRPPWDCAGVRFVPDAAPYERIKMRVLNAAQSTFAHLGALCGFAFSYEAACDPVLSRLVRNMLLEETASTLAGAPGTDVVTYVESAMSRIRDETIKHRCHQIGTDGSQKIEQRLLAPFRERLAAGRTVERLLLAVAGWLAYVLAGARRYGARWTASDPWAAALIGRADAGGSTVELARFALSLSPIFGTDLGAAGLVARLARHLTGLLEGDPHRYLRDLDG